MFQDISASTASESHPQKDEEIKSNIRNKTKSRVKSSSRRMFLDNSVSDEEVAADDTDKTIGGGMLDAFSNKNWSGHQSECAEDGENEDAEQDSSPIPPGTTLDNSWTCPLTFDEVSPSPGDPENEDSSSPRPVSHFSGPNKSPVRSNSCSGVILKLRRMFSKGLNRKKARYQAVSDSGTFPDPSQSQTDDAEEEASGEMNLHRRMPKATHGWQRTGSFSHALRPLGSSSKRKRRSLLKIKYCPYLSACHSAEHRRRWVLRSAVQRAQRAMRLCYPDLVGKRIRHLYEEDDKSEVWYRGEVLRVHEPHTNPLKTIFEVRYDSEPEWKYYLELLIDYKKGWLKIED